MSYQPNESATKPTNELVQLNGELISTEEGKSNLLSFTKPFNEERTDDTLVVEVYQNKNIKLFLQLSGITWPFREDSYLQQCSQNVWSGFMRFCIIAVNALAVLFFSIAAANQRLEAQEGLIFALICLTVLLQSAVLVPSLYTAFARLNSTAMQIEIPFYTKSLKAAIFVFVISFGSGIIFPLYVLNFGFKEIVAWFMFLIPAIVGEFSVASFLAMNILFLSVDAKVCLSLVESLIDQQRGNTISIQSFTMVRTEIKNRVDKSKWKTNSVVCVAVLDIIVLVLIVLFGPEMVSASERNQRADDDSDDAHNPFKFSIPYFITMSTFFIKELPFLIIVLWESAKVNEKSDLLTKLLGAAGNNTSSFHEKQTTFFTTPSGEDQNSDTDTDTGTAVNPIASVAMDTDTTTGKMPRIISTADDDVRQSSADTSPLLLLMKLEQGYSMLRQEYNRLSIYATAESDKISLPLAGMRLKRRDVVIRFGLWTVTLVIGLVKAAIASGVGGGGGGDR